MTDRKEIKDFIKQIQKSKGRLATLLVLAERNDWQDCSAVYRKSTKISRHSTNYVFEFGRFPSIFEFSTDDKQIRISPERFEEVQACLEGQ